MANPTVTIDGVDRTGKTKVNTVSIRRSLNDRSAMSVELIELAGTYRPVVGDQIVVTQDAVIRFGGYIESIEEQLIPGSNLAIAYRCECVDYSRLLDWRIYAGSFENQPFIDIVTTIMDAKFDGDGISLAGVEDPGVTIVERINDGLRPVTEWFRKIATATGYFFRIDDNKVLQFGPLNVSNPAPFSLTSASRNKREMRIIRRMGDYRNRQYVRTEYTISSGLATAFVGDGTTKDWFQFEGPFQGTPVVTLDTGAGPVAQTVGRWGFDLSGFDFYYDVEGWGLHRYPAQSAPGVGDDIAMTYGVRFQNYTVEQDAAEIAARAAIQNDSGVIEAISEDRYIDSAAGLTARATDLLRQFGAIPTQIEFETNTAIEPTSNGLEPGQQITVNLTDGPSNVNDTFLIETVESSWMVAAPSDIWTHRCKCTDLEPSGIRVAVTSAATAIERLAEAVRIGPDIGTVITESPPDPGVKIGESATFGVEVDSDLTVEDDVTNHIDVATDGIPFEVRANQKDWPQAANTVVDIEFRPAGGAWASIFPSGEANHVVITSGSTAQFLFTTFVTGAEILAGGHLRMNIEQGTASGLNVKLRWK